MHLVGVSHQQHSVCKYQTFFSFLGFQTWEPNAIQEMSNKEQIVLEYRTPGIPAVKMFGIKGPNVKLLQLWVSSEAAWCKDLLKYRKDSSCSVSPKSHGMLSKDRKKGK